MPRHDEPILRPADLIQLVMKYRTWWAVPAVAGLVLAAAYALVAPRKWQATQAFTIRSEAASVSEQRLGKFSDLSEMKVRQETILELAKSQSVIQETLRAVDPSFSDDEPTARDVEDFRDQIDMRPPGGAEFGETEVFYLSVRDKNRDRAAEFVGALSDQLERRLQSLRDERAQSMMAELGRTVAMAENDLAGRNEQLAQFEAEIGADLAELRNLNSLNGGQSDTAERLQAIAIERRANEDRRRENEQLLALLHAAQEDPRQLLATPRTLLESQPALSRLKDALVDAQVNTANLLGYLAEDHPFVVAARETEQHLQQQLHSELAVAIKGLNVDLEFSAGRGRSLDEKAAQGQQRLARLAGARAEYASLVAAVENHTAIVEAARTNLADARADQASAHAASIIGRIDGVAAGVRPIGPGRTTITAAGGVAGLILGFGLIFLFGDFAVSASPVAKPQAAAPVVDEKVAAQVSPAAEPFGMFHGMTLDEAIRSVEQRFGRQHVNS